jgi:hypothetical protein
VLSDNTNQEIRKSDAAPSDGDEHQSDKPSGSSEKPEAKPHCHECKNQNNWPQSVTLGLALIAAAASSGSALYASRQVDAAIDANGITREAFTSVPRAFVTVSSFDTPVRLDPNDKIKYWSIPSIKNSGNTPTKNMRYFITATCPAELDIGMGAHMSIDCDFTRRPEPIDPEDLLKRPDFKDKASAAILGPQTAIPLTGIGITEKSVRAIQKGFPLFVGGLFITMIFSQSPNCTLRNSVIKSALRFLTRRKLSSVMISVSTGTVPTMNVRLIEKPITLKSQIRRLHRSKPLQPHLSQPRNSDAPPCRNRPKHLLLIDEPELTG